LRKPFEGHRRARRGEYRVRYTIDEALREVIVLDVNHRRDAYR
jgi:mRNA-degrading endonuclease RelE of RelBE toxin-antitoxin system